MVNKKRDLVEIREHQNDESNITTILGFTANQFDRFKREVYDEFQELYEECDTSVAAGLFLLDRVLKVDNPDPDTVARAICLHKLLEMGCAIQCKALMDELQHIVHTHPKTGLCAVALSPPRSIFEKPKLMVLQDCGGDDDDSACCSDPEKDEEDADRLSYIR
jgi:hypothetical protein